MHQYHEQPLPYFHGFFFLQALSQWSFTNTNPSWDGDNCIRLWSIRGIALPWHLLSAQDHFKHLFINFCSEDIISILFFLNVQKTKLSQGTKKQANSLCLKMAPDTILGGKVGLREEKSQKCSQDA